MGYAGRRSGLFLCVALVVTLFRTWRRAVGSLCKALTHTPWACVRRTSSASLLGARFVCPGVIRAVLMFRLAFFRTLRNNLLLLAFFGRFGCRTFFSSGVSGQLARRQPAGLFTGLTLACDFETNVREREVNNSSCHWFSDVHWGGRNTWKVFGMKCSFQALPMALALAPTVWVLPAAYRMIFQNSMRQLNRKGKI